MLAKSFGEGIDAIEKLMPIAEDRIDTYKSLDKLGILAFLKSFEQFEDVLQKTIKTIIQVMEQGKIERLTGVDIANRGASLGIFDDADRWSDAVRARNALAYEYPLDRGKRAAQLNNAWAMREVLHEVWSDIRLFVEREGLR